VLMDKFKCPVCGSSHFGSELEAVTHKILARYCNGTLNGSSCRFKWDPKDDAKYGLVATVELDEVEPLPSTTFFDHMELANGIVTMDEFVRKMMDMPTEELKKRHDVDSCPESECLVCGIIICPHKEPLHCHHDGCPACE